jgi:probable HAF family extracellular repeat protein
MKTTLSAIAALIAVALCAARAVAAPPLYHVTNLGILYPLAINIQVPFISQPAVVGSALSITHLTTPHGMTARPTKLNDSGQMSGDYFFSSNLESSGFRSAPYAVANPSTDDIGSLRSTPDIRFTFPMDINNAGQIVGTSVTDSGAIHAFRTAPNSRISPGTDDLGTLGTGPVSGLAIQAGR